MDRRKRMKRRFGSLVVSAVLALGMAMAARGADPATGFRAEFMAEVDSVGKKLTDLAGAVPQEKYSWRPAPGVRSVSEVYVHVAAANYGIPSFLGVKVPEGISRDMEKTVTEKAKVLEALQKSFGHLKSVAANMSDADLDKSVKVFGREMTQRATLMLILNHMHEHLGQSIAYARTNGVVPPWSEGGESAPAKKS
jgi:uncharacterized damage-inducible protein DinB